MMLLFEQLSMSLLNHLAQLEVGPLPNHGGGDPAQGAVSVVLRLVFGVVGAVAMLIIVISGFRYIVSAGDPGQMAQAKKTIVYALIGLLVALSGFSIVAFVVKGL